MSWDPLQREVLAAMGHVVYALDMPGTVAAPAQADAAQDASEATATVAPLTSGPLLRALLRAAGRTEADAEALRLCRDALPAAGLDAAARRALWPRLRALRAGRVR